MVCYTPGCGHRAESHDSGGCCKVAFCSCSRLILTSPESPQPLHATVRLKEPAPMAPIKSFINEIAAEPRSPLLSDFNIEEASFSDLTKWAYKARTKLKEFGQ